MALTRQKYEFIKREVVRADTRLAQLDELIATHKKTIEKLEEEKLRVLTTKSVFTEDLKPVTDAFERDRFQ